MTNLQHLPLAAVGAVLLAAVLVVLLVFLVARRRRRKTAPGTTPVEAPITFRSGLSKTRQALGARLGEAFRRDRSCDAWLDDLEEALIVADVGVATTGRLLEAVRQHPHLDSPDAVLAALKVEIRNLLEDDSLKVPEVRPLVILVAGVNGVGKTTTIGKLAHRYKSEGKRVILVAADTFRAAATEQLQIWADRVGCDLIKQQSGSDPSAVVFDGVKAARSRDADVAIIDTAGRLHVKVNLMAELTKIVRVIGRELPGAPHEAFLVLDATTGQNALSQARLFKEALPLTGVVLTKLDGTAKGGAVLAVKSELGLPLRYLGLGEGIDDLRPFDPGEFAEALFEE